MFICLMVLGRQLKHGMRKVCLQIVTDNDGANNFNTTLAFAIAIMRSTQRLPSFVCGRGQRADGRKSLTFRSWYRTQRLIHTL
jgi:hypothetical protein